MSESIYTLRVSRAAAGAYPTISDALAATDQLYPDAEQAVLLVRPRGWHLEEKHVLVDGERIAATDQVFGLSDLQFGWIPLEAIERVEIVRGPLELRAVLTRNGIYTP